MAFINMKNLFGKGTTDVPVGMDGINDEIDKTQDVDDSDIFIDLLKVRPYVQALSDFIEDCDTPMSIAIQGDWGSGKTSIMNMVRRQLDNADGYVTIGFNTWESAQFNMEKGLTVSFINHAVSELQKCIGKKDHTSAAVDSVRSFLKTGLQLGLGLSGVENQTFHEVMDHIGFSENLKKLKTNFKLIINETCASLKLKKIIFFIDDLDRIKPETAITFLEVMKIFLDVDSCVFVLALDYDVVSMGARQKFGEGFSDAKADSFFDKIIQLPFKMPVELYDVGGYLIERLNYPFSPTMKKVAIDLIKRSIGNNPRTINRLTNSYKLISRVIYYQNKSDNNEDISILGREETEVLLLLSILCIQMSNEALYRYLISDNEWSEPDSKLAKILTDRYTQEELRDCLKSIHELHGNSTISEERALKKTELFLQTLSKVICNNQTSDSSKNVNSAQRLEQFGELLNYSAITSVNIAEPVNDQHEYLPITSKIAGRQVLGICIDGKENSFKFGRKSANSGFLWTLTRVCRSSDYARNWMNHAIDHLPDARFNSMFNEMMPDSRKRKLSYSQNAIHSIEGTDAIIHTEFSSQKLMEMLVTLLKEMHENVNRYEIIVSMKDEPGVEAESD